MQRLTPSEDPAVVRSRIMRAIRRANTTTELRVRSALHQRGVRYRVKNRDLPGSPDLANRSKGWVIFVNGCFWHGHRNCPHTGAGHGYRVPVAHREYWAGKLAENRRRDARVARLLRNQGFRVYIIWECQSGNVDASALCNKRAGTHNTPRET